MSKPAYSGEYGIWQKKIGYVNGVNGEVDIDEGYGNALIFEVNLKGEIINPNDFYVMDPSKIEA